MSLLAQNFSVADKETSIKNEKTDMNLLLQVMFFLKMLTAVGFGDSQFKSLFSPNKYDSGIDCSNLSPPIINDDEK